MVSNAPNSQSYNFTHMFSMTDLRGPLPVVKACPDTLLSFIENNSDFSIFLYLVKLANFRERLNEKQANFTLFLPSDKELLKRFNENVFTNMDPTTAWYIVKSSLLRDRISSEILEDSPAAYYYTDSQPNRMFITNMNGQTYINNCIRIIKKDILTKNGIIHIIDSLIIPNVL